MIRYNVMIQYVIWYRIYDKILYICAAIWCDTRNVIQYMIWYNILWYNVMWYDNTIHMIWYNIWYNPHTNTLETHSAVRESLKSRDCEWVFLKSRRDSHRQIAIRNTQTFIVDLDALQKTLFLCRQHRANLQPTTTPTLYSSQIQD